MRKLYIVMLLLILLCFPVISFLEDDIEWLEYENRNANTLDNISWNQVFDGTWMVQFEEYLKDQIPGRAIILKCAHAIRGMYGEKERNGYFMGKEGYILPVKTMKNLGNVRGEIEPFLYTIKKMNEQVKNTSSQLVVLDIPHKSDFCGGYYVFPYQNELEYYEEKSRIKETFFGEENIHYINTYSILQKHADEYLYFKTDHHYTGRGAYYVYRDLIDYLNRVFNEKINVFDIRNAEIKKNEQRFVGSSLKKIGDDGKDYGDYLEEIIPSEFPKHYIRVDTGKEKITKLFDLTWNSYSAFMLGDYGNTIVKTGRKEFPNILFIGYSYTNALEYFSVANFNEVHSIDPRYFEGNITKYICENNLDYVVVVRDDLTEENMGEKCSLW